MASLIQWTCLCKLLEIVKSDMLQSSGSHKDPTYWLNNNDNNSKVLLIEWISISIYVWSNAAEFIGNKVNQ